MAAYAMIRPSKLHFINKFSENKTMTTGKKYSYRVAKNRKNWKVEIIRQVTSRKTVVSKRKTGFETEAEAIKWAEKELKSFIENQLERNKRHAKQRVLRDEKEEQDAQVARDAQKIIDTKKEKGTRDEEDF